MGIKDFFSKNKGFAENVDELSFDFEEPQFECIEFEQEPTKQEVHTPQRKPLPKEELEKIVSVFSNGETAMPPTESLPPSQDSNKTSDIPRGNYRPIMSEADAYLPFNFDYPNYNPADIKAKDDTKAKTKFFYKPKAPINIVFLVIENTDKVRTYKNDVLSLVRRLIESNKTSLFLLLQTGDNPTCSELIDYEDITSQKLIDVLLVNCQDSQATVDIVSAMQKISSFLKEKYPLYEFKFKEKDYKITGTNVIFIGTGSSNVNTESQKNSFSSTIKTLRKTTCVKNIKYFCMEDIDTIKTSALGFPVIGHIVSDFYK